MSERRTIIPNRPDHYEADGLEIDVYSDKIIIRQKRERDSESRREKKEDPKPRERQRDPEIGPITSRLLGKLGF